ncbi:hypothetical protein [Amycolatopsis echigonensis]|uniref:Uncharacterized protein n=1 Tax=Amycolatopsis echigonensis TaxID=2576905 RepID=A0A8E1W9K6_9PSEU|nr:hypothetical protein [Amycolatopsis echigonensis]MBB2505999.1 hypothetical protein [Amycolatopsis echigonensis]
MSAANEELLDKIDALRKENDAIRDRVAYLVGWYGDKATTNEELAELVGQLRAVLDRTWVEPGNIQ